MKKIVIKKKISFFLVFLLTLVTCLSCLSYLKIDNKDQKVMAAEEKIKPKKKEYSIVLDSTYAPFEFQNAKGKYVGIDVELIKAIAKEEGFKFTYKYPGFQAAVDSVSSGQADGIIAGMSITEERKQSFDFSDPYFDSGIEVAISKDDAATVKDYEDLKGKTIGVKNGTTSQEWLNQNSEKYGFAIKTFDDGDAMYNALNVKAVDGIMDDAPVLDYAIVQGKKFVIVGDKQPAGQYGFAVKKGKNPELVAAFNQGLAKLKANGKYDEIVAKYVGETKIKPKKDSYSIVLDSTYAPFEFQNDKGKYVGIDVELIKAIAKEEGFTFTYKFPGFQAAVDSVSAGQADGIIAGMSITDERKQSFDFSNPYFDSGIEIAVNKATKDIKDFPDLKGKTVGVKNGTTSQEWLNKNKGKYGYTIKTFDDGDAMYNALNVKAVDAIMDDAPVLDYAIVQGKDFVIVGDKQPAGQYGFAVKKGKNPELVAAFNEGLTKLKENGKYDEIVSKYVGGSSSEKSDDVDETTFAGLIKNNWKPLLVGLGKTLSLTLVSFILASIIGIILGLCAVTPIKPLRAIATVYVDVIRGVPLMVLVFFIFYGIPHLLNHPLNDYVAGVIALTLNASAYITEIFRGGINAVDKGQIEASRSLGLPYLKTMQKIVLPQAIKIMSPSLINQFVISLKDTTIISVIGVIELLQASKIIVARNLQSLRVYFIVGVMYLIVITLLTKLSKMLERRIQ
ncbi:MAG: amino acid ABC transporter substrate-binding protein/permease [Lachnospiraceae bacterium]|jgi:polar amino acid transport system substrate-binding protein|nr:amino acid ABC transporter substrate-binding protein/permease [Lachnospiraceae bacterium]